MRGWLWLLFGVTFLVPTTVNADDMFDGAELKSLFNMSQASSCKEECSFSEAGVRYNMLRSKRNPANQFLQVYLVEKGPQCGSRGCPSAILMRVKDKLVLLNEGLGLGPEDVDIAINKSRGLPENSATVTNTAKPVPVAKTPKTVAGAQTAQHQYGAPSVRTNASCEEQWKKDSVAGKIPAGILHGSFMLSCMSGTKAEPFFYDPVMGAWWDGTHLKLEVSKEGVYIVQLFQNSGATLVGTFAGPIKDGQVQTNGGVLIVAGERAFFQGAEFRRTRP